MSISSFKESKLSSATPVKKKSDFFFFLTQKILRSFRKKQTKNSLAWFLLMLPTHSVR